jgi:ubiquinol-cytochrome c reductase cytochrome b subunit
MHLIALYDHIDSGNSLSISSNYDIISFVPYFLFKDLITIFLFIPNVLGDSENYVIANPIQTPPAIIPE